MRETTFLRRAEGVWSITHEHVSLPFHLEILQPWLPAGKDDRPVLTAGGGA
ncbi:hypothetical protein [Kitasatospora griseola]|uniref:hypothetical protein n=1 Tax=Kitasatospora griseola TaxID=2064 RepID=UPI0037FD2D76